MKLKNFLTNDGRDIFQEWLNDLHDVRGMSAIVRRLDRLQHHDNFGDHKYCRDGVWELRIDVGPGYRIYFGKDHDDVLVLLLCGGDKSTQRKDITKAIMYWMNYLKREANEQIKQ